MHPSLHPSMNPPAHPSIFILSLRLSSLFGLTILIFTLIHFIPKGYYAFLETSSPYQPGMKGRLISKQYKASSSMCFDFWYFMYGKSVGSLTVYMENSSGRTNLWTRDGNQGNDWLEANIPLSSPTDFKVKYRYLTSCHLISLPYT